MRCSRGLLTQARSLLVVGVFFVTGCEAPLDLSGVEKSSTEAVLRIDMFQAAASDGQKSVLVSSTGAALVKEASADAWLRSDLKGRPSLIDVAACDNGDFIALDAEHGLWHLPIATNVWQSKQITTNEATLALTCAPDATVWVAGGFSTLLSSSDFGVSWQEFSLQEDLQFTAITFVSRELGYAAGEFGTVVKTDDGGKSWQRVNDLPNEFYPMDMLFADPSNGWVVGLNGIVWRTTDAGNSWNKEQTPVNASLYTLAGLGNSIVAVGDGGTVIVRKTQGWQVVPDVPSALSYLRAATVTPSGNLIAAGGAGTLIQLRLIADDE